MKQFVVAFCWLIFCAAACTEEAKSPSTAPVQPARRYVSKDLYAGYIMQLPDAPHILGAILKENPGLAKEVDANRQSWLWNAVKYNQIDCAALLIAHGADPNYSDGSTPFQMAIQQGKRDLVSMLWHAGGRCDDALHRAFAQPEIALMLLARGVDVNSIEPSLMEETALHRAAAMGTVEVVRVLVRNGADVNIENGFGDTPLDAAMYWGKADIVRVLEAAGAKRGSGVARKK